MLLLTCECEKTKRGKQKFFHFGVKICKHQRINENLHVPLVVWVVVGGGWVLGSPLGWLQKKKGEYLIERTGKQPGKLNTKCQADFLALLPFFCFCVCFIWQMTNCAESSGRGERSWGGGSLSLS